MREMVAQRMKRFRQRCLEHGLALTHQRLIIYEAIASTSAHPTPEAVYEAIRDRLPSVSLATVYKNIRTFAELGLLREVNLLHDSVRLDANLDEHHHLVCVRCKAVVDLPKSALAPVRLKAPLPGDFQAQKFNVEVLGTCSSCASASSRGCVATV